MNHQDHVNLLRGGIPSPGGTWADLGSGWGAFTLALAELIGPQGKIYSIDLDQKALRRQEQALRTLFPQVEVTYHQADFTRPLSLPTLDGVVMANSLHFVKPKAKPEVVECIRGYLKPGGHLILVEYNVDTGNPWVPYPISYESWARIAHQAGFEGTRLLSKRPSSFLKEIYAALSW